MVSVFFCIFTPKNNFITIKTNKMIHALFNYKPKGLTKEEILAEFDNLLAYEQEEVYREIDNKIENFCLRHFSTQELREELNRRGYTVC